MCFVAVISEPDRQSPVAIYRSNVEMNSGVQLQKGKKTHTKSGNVYSCYMLSEISCLSLLYVLACYTQSTLFCIQLITY